MERRSFTLAAALGAVLAGAPVVALAQPPARPAAAPGRGLSELLKLRPGQPGAEAPRAARYVAESVVFTFDRSTPTVRFEGTREVVALSGRRGSRGDTDYVNDVGETVLKVTGLGGMTLFTPEYPQGAAAQLVGVATPIQLEAIRATQLIYRMGEASNRMSRLVGREVGFDAPNIGPESNALCWDVVNHVLLAYEKNARRERSKARTARVHIIEITEGAQPDIKISGDKMLITVAPSKGLFGRPSSEKISRALAR